MFAERCYVADNLKRARIKAGLSIPDVAKAMHLDRVTVWRIENGGGSYLPRYRKAIKVAEWIRGVLA